MKLISASNIIKLRTEAGLTQAELGEKLNYSDKTISKWERGEAIPDAYVLTQMAEIFGAESNEMMVLMTELTVNPHTAGFFASFKNDAYSKYNSLLMVGDRRENLRKEILELL